MKARPALAAVPVAADPVESAKTAGLRYVDDRRPGIRRVGSGRGFRYVGPDGKPVKDPSTIERIRKLAIPPAWTDVWICPLENGHIQATGRDQRGRKQYRYHARWHEVRDENKFERMIAFGEALPVMRARVARDIAREGMPREKVLATVVRLLETTFIRIGNAEYARDNASYGLTTLRNRHVDVRGDTLRFRFRGKSGKDIAVDLSDKRVARIVRRCQDLPGHELFCYVEDDGTVRDVDSGDVNAYLKEISGQEFTAKDFRTWAGTILAAEALCACAAEGTPTALKKNVAAAVKDVAARLANTPAVCRKHYIHPAIFDSYLCGTLLASFQRRGRGRAAERGLSRAERALLALLRRAAVEPPGEALEKRLAASLRSHAHQRRRPAAARRSAR